jgi:spermidine/putrescine transport system permease protein
VSSLPPSNAVVWYGHLTSKLRLRVAATMLCGIGIAWLMIFLVLPCFVLVGLAFAQRGTHGTVEWSFTFENFTRLAGWGIFGWSGDYLRILGRSVLIASVTTLACLLLAYPLAFFIASRSPRSRYLWLMLVIIPLCTNLVIRTYAWILIFSPQLPPARFAAWLGMIEQGQGLYPGTLAVYVGMLTSALPFAVLPIYANVERMDWSLIDAARDLYASRLRIITHAVIPQTLPGLYVAVILTFVPAMGMFVVPDMLGGSKTMLVGNLIQQQFDVSRDKPFGAAISVVLVALTLIGLCLIRRRREGVELV